MMGRRLLPLSPVNGDLFGKEVQNHISKCKRHRRPDSDKERGKIVNLNQRMDNFEEKEKTGFQRNNRGSVFNR